MQTVTIKLDSKWFQKGLGRAKSVGGKFNPSSKTWEVPADCKELLDPARWGWIIVSGKPAASSPAWGDDEFDNLHLGM